MIANEEGTFAFPLNALNETDTLVISAIGYQTAEIPIHQPSPLRVSLRDTTYTLSEVAVRAITAEALLDSVAKHRRENYPDQPYGLEGFYRVSYRENGTYVRLLEMAMVIYDPDFW